MAFSAAVVGADALGLLWAALLLLCLLLKYLRKNGISGDGGVVEVRGAESEVRGWC